MRRRPVPTALAAAAALVLGACSATDGRQIDVSAATDAKARLLAGVAGPTGWAPQANQLRALDMARYEVGEVPLTVDTDGGVSIGFVSPELDEPATYRTGCDAVAEYLGRMQAALAADTDGATVAFDADACVTSLGSTATDDGRAITDTQSVPIWSGGATATDRNQYLLGLLRLGGAGENPRRLNVIVGWRPAP